MKANIIKMYRYLKYGPIYAIPVPMPGVMAFVDKNGEAVALWNETQQKWEEDMPITDENFYWSD